MGRYKYLLKNIGLLTISSFATKLLSFFLVPLYTNILSTTEYGIYDLFITTIGVLVPILTLNIQEAVMRFSMDVNSNKNAIITVATKYLIISNIIVVTGLIINTILGINEIVYKYSFLFFLMFLSQSLSGIVIMYIRGIDRIADLSVSSVITSIVTISFNLLFLLVFKWGIVGYFLANILGPLFQCIYLVIRARMYRRICFREDYSVEKKSMVEYSRPLIANSIAWWVNNASDRYIIVLFCGLAANGIYSVASKIPSILNLFQTIFNQAWTLSAVKDFDPEDKNGFFSNTYKAYNCMMVIICSAIIFADKILAKLIYAKDFYAAWKYVPWLTIAIVFGALSGYIGGFFAAVKDSKAFALSTIIGAITNLVLNFILTPIWKAMGAALATTICFSVTWAFRLYKSRKYIKLNINFKRDIFTYVLLVCQSLIILYFTGILMYLLSGMVFVFICLLYIKDIGLVVRKVLKK